LIQADAGALPLPEGAIDVACSAFGAIPFVPDSAAVMREVARVLRPGGRWVFSTTTRCAGACATIRDRPGWLVERSYFDRRSYVEHDADGRALYVEAHRTIGDRYASWSPPGSPCSTSWNPSGRPVTPRMGTVESAARGALPGTAIFVAELAR